VCNGANDFLTGERGNTQSCEYQKNEPELFGGGRNFRAPDQSCLFIALFF
jgi:hypothetical protein